MKNLLKDTAREKIENIQLSTDQLEALDALQLNSSHDQTRHKRNRQWWYRMAGVAAVVALMMGLLLPNLIKTPDSLITEIAAEVVKNHLHRKPLEVKTSQLDDIRGYFTRLDFVPVRSNYLDSKRLSLMGGRYCSLQGVTAAQLRFESSGNDGVNTLYQVGYDPEVFRSLPDYDQNQTPVTTYSSGIKVTLWVEKGVLFALTEDLETKNGE